MQDRSNFVQSGRRSAGLLVVVVASVTAPAMTAKANSAVVQWTTGTGANGNYYQRVDSHPAVAPLSFTAARTAAQGMTFTVGANTYTGRLAVLDPNYTNAFAFLRDSVIYGATGTGAPPSNEMYWVGALSPTGAASPNAWVWENGTPVPNSVVATWSIDQFEGAGPEGIGYFQSTSNQLWDYIATGSTNQAYGYVVEFAVPEPAAAGLVCAASGAWACSRRRRRRQVDVSPCAG
jgi:hypothetical protein